MSFAWACSAVTFAAALGVLAIGIHKGTFAAADSDPYGYVSEADLLARGSLRIEQQFARTVPWPLAEWTFAPLGYRPAPTRGFIVPTYPLGLPLTMAAVQRVKNRDAVFYVVPFLGALAVWITGRLGASIHGPLTGAMSAVLLASSPTFLLQLIQPVSDVPATAWWTLSLALAVRGSSHAALGSGVAGSMAILTRPNLVPLALVLGAFFMAPAFRAERGGARRRALRPLTLFACGVIPGCLVVGGINQYLYGSALRSGYAELHTLYAWSHVTANLDRYPRWLLQSETPFMCVALLAPWVGAWKGAERAAQVRLLLVFAAGIFASYLFYVPFGRDESGYLRFLLPAYPALIVLSAGVAIDALRHIASGLWHASVSIALCAAVVGWHVQTAAARDIFTLQNFERRYVDVGRYVAAAMPREAVFIAGLHTGSIRYYSDRLTLRYDLLQPGWLDEAVRTLGARGYHPYIALEEGEEPDFREQFDRFSELSRLDWPPTAERREPVRVRIYDPADRARFLAGAGIVTGDIALMRKPTLTRK